MCSGIAPAPCEGRAGWGRPKPLSRVPLLLLFTGLVHHPAVDGRVLLQPYSGVFYGIMPTMGAVSLFQGSMIFSLISHLPCTFTQVST